VPDAAQQRPQGLQAWMGLCEVVDRVRVLINRDLHQAVGLTLAENLVLCQVAMAPQHRLRMIEVAEILSVAKSAVTKTVDRLEERGLLGRERDPGDRRTVYAALTPEGQKVFAAARPAFVDAVQRRFAGQIDESSLRQLLDLPRSVFQPAPGQGPHPNGQWR
jgi:DNA-binding MarR family transcriptional regulator